MKGRQAGGQAANCPAGLFLRNFLLIPKYGSNRAIDGQIQASALKNAKHNADPGIVFILFCKCN